MATSSRATHAAQGYSLVELLIVISLFSLIAAIATPALFDDNDGTLDNAAAAVATALRTARSEAIRTGKPYGVNAESFAQSVRVYRLDETVSPAAVIYDVYHPLNKQLYDLRFDTEDVATKIDTVYFKFDGFFVAQNMIGFAGVTGAPKYNFFGSTLMLETGYVRMSLDGQTRTISISPVTGRVTVT